MDHIRGWISGIRSRKELVEEDDVREEGIPTFSCDEAIEKIGFGRFQWMMLFMCGACWAADAMEMMLLSFLLPEATLQFNLKDWEQALVGSIVFAGMLVGASFWGRISDNFGRKLAFMLTSCITGIFGVASAFAPSYIWLLVLRGLVGFGLGGAHVAFSLFAEFLPQSKRGRPLILFELFWTVGTVSESGLAWIVLPRMGWRYLLLFSAVPVLLLLLCYPLMPESPRFLLVNGQRRKAMEQLEAIARMNKTAMPDGTLAPLPKSAHTKADKKFILTQLFSKPLRRMTLLMWLIWFSNSFVYYGLVLFAPALYKAERDEAETDENNAVYLDVLITSAAEIPGLLMASFAVDKIGRRPTLSVFFFLCCISVGLLAVPAGSGFLLGSSISARCFIMGTFSVVYVYTQEAYPTSVRSSGLGICSSMARIAGIVTPFISDVLSAEELYLPIIIYASVAFIAAVSSALLPFETKGRAMAETTHDDGDANESSPLIVGGRKHNKV